MSMDTQDNLKVSDCCGAEVCYDNKGQADEFGPYCDECSVLCTPVPQKTEGEDTPVEPQGKGLEAEIYYAKNGDRVLKCTECNNPETCTCDPMDQIKEPQDKAGEYDPPKDMTDPTEIFLWNQGGYMFSADDRQSIVDYMESYAQEAIRRELEELKGKIERRKNSEGGERIGKGYVIGLTECVGLINALINNTKPETT